VVNLPEPTYLLDANVFIQAKRKYYRFAVCPGFWEALIWHCDDSSCCSLDKVKAELLAGNDDLAQWAKSVVPSAMFKSTNDSKVVQWYSQMVQWVQSQPQFKPEAKAEFAQVADGWLVAYAKALSMTVVTLETYDAAIRKRVPIPNVCTEFAVPWLDTFQMLEACNASFNWSRPA
jgi:hypothetical protein